MVAVVTGNTLGLVAGSAGVLGGNGQLGSAATGRGGDVAFVNASTGNLTIQRQDELLLGLGPDIGIVRTYNSQGTFDFDNNDNWQISLYRRVFGLTGTVNTAGSTIKRTSADGAELTYTYDSTVGSPTLGKYVNKDGAGSYDTLTYNSVANTWTWQDGDSRATETFELQVAGTYRIKTLTDADGNALTYTYNTTAGLTELISEISTAAGEKTQLVYNATKQLTQINVVNSSSVTTTRVRYTYENATVTARLTSVSTDLLISDGLNSIADGKTYTTTYTYDGISKRIASITNSDGTKTSFTYETTGLFRVLTVVDGTNNITTFAYPSSSTTTITDAKSQITTLTYSILTDSSQKLLTRMEGPATSGQDVNYLYDTSGNVLQMTDSRGNITKYSYDANGNLTRQEDAAGNTITRTYTSTNQLLTEVVYATPDSVPGDVTYNAALPQTTRYAYDVEEHLRFIVSPEGRVTEYRYNANGTRATAIQYTANLFSGTADETTLSTWVTTTVTDKTKSQRTDYTYDVRGQLSSSKVYASVDAAGAGVATTQAITQYSYDQTGNLVQSINARNFITGYSYDGLNRLSTQTDALGNVTTSIYNDSTATIINGGTNLAANSAAVRFASVNGNALVSINAYDLAGRLISTANTNATNAVLGTTSYLYDSLGILRQSTDATGQNTYYLYDSLGRKVGVIDPQLALTEYVYNNNNQVVRIIQYTNAVTASLTPATALTNTLATAGIRVATPATDRINRNLYDKAGRLAKQIDAMGAVTEYRYDGASRLVKTIGYANNTTQLTAAQLTAIDTTTGDITHANGILTLVATNTVITLTTDVTDRITRQIYSNDGLLLGNIDAEGYHTKYTYDAAGRQTRVKRYVNQVQTIGTATLDSGLPQSVSIAPSTGNQLYVVSIASTVDQASYYMYNARGQLEGKVDLLNESTNVGYLTEYQYDLVGNRTLTIRYATSITYTVGASVAASRPAAANLENQLSTLTYDANNRISSNTSAPDGLITNYTYDAVGNLTQKVNTFASASPTEIRAQFKQYDLLGRVTRELSGEGVLYLQSLGATPTQIQIDDAWDSYGTRYSYDLAGRVIVAITPNGSNAAGNKSLYYYDTEGKLKYQINAVGEVTEFIYSKFDQRTATRQYITRIVVATLTSMQTVAATATTGVVSTTVNTAADTALTALNTGVASYTETLTAYDNAGRATTLTDALGNANTRTYNAFGELFTATNRIDPNNPAAPTAPSVTVTTQYAYDKRGMVKTTTEDGAGINRITQAVYDAFGRITQTTDGRGSIVNRTYDGLGREVVVTDALNTQTQTTYDAFSRVLTRKDGRGVAGTYNTVSYSYNSTARSMTMTTGEGVGVVMTRNRFGETVTVTDGRNNNTTYTYNADGQLKTVTSPTGAVTQTTYDAAGHVVTTTDAYGVNTFYAYDAANRVLSRSVDPTGLNLTTEYRYDALGRQTWVKDAKNVWTRTDYDAKGQVTSMVVDPSLIPDATGNLLNPLVANAAGLNISTSFSYDARGKRLTVVEGAGSAQPKTTAYTYDKLGRLTQTAIDPAGLNLRTSYTYDKNDNVVLKTDANTNKTVYSYDANNRLIYTVDALGYVTKNDYDIDGNLITTTAYAALTTTVLTTLQNNPTTTPITVIGNAADRISSNVYDKDNRRTFSMDALKYVTKYEYDANRNVTRTTKYATMLVSLPLAGVAPTVTLNAADQVTQMTYDAANRRTYSMDALGYVTKYEYDANSNITRTTRYATAAALPALGAVPVVTVALTDQVTQMTYDTANRVNQSTDALGIITKYGYDANGNQTSVIEAFGSVAQRTIYQVFDAANRVNQSTDALGIVSQYTYDANGNQLTVTEAFGTAAQRTTYQAFDAANRKISATDALGNKTETTYDAMGNIVTVKDALGNMGYFYYDAANQMTLQVNPEGAATETLYSAFGNQTDIIRYSNKVVGTLSASSKPVIGGATGTYVPLDANFDQLQKVAYDVAGRKLNIKTAFANIGGQTLDATNSYTESFTYDAFGNVSTSTARNGAVTTYSYDAINRKATEILPINSRNASNALIAVQNNFSYDAVGNLTAKTEAVGLPEQRITTYTYTLNNQQASELVNVYLNATTTSTPSSKTKTYDALGNISSETDANNKITYYYYDLQNRKTASIDANNVMTAMVYDAVSNKSSQTTYKIPVTGQTVTNKPTPTLDAANDRSIYYTYDKMGHETKSEILNMVVGTVGASNLYNALNTTALSKQTEYDELGNIKKTIDANDNVTRAYYNLAGEKLAEVDAAGYLSTWTRDAYGNVVTETKYANKVQTMGAGSLDSNNAPQILSSAPVAGSDAVYVLTNTATDRITNYSYDRLNRVLTEARANVAQGTVNSSNGLLTSNTATATTTYTYNGLGNVIQKTDAVGATTNWVYDAIGRETSQINPIISAFDVLTNTTISKSPRTDKEYDGLNNLKRTINRGIIDTADAATVSGQVETDDQITSYTYSTGGRLTTETQRMGATNATGIVTQYEYDYNGNIIKRVLKDRQTAEQAINGVIADNLVADDISTYTYDNLNRQLSSSTKSTAETTYTFNQVQYNSFGEVTNKRTYTNTTGTLSAATTWDEFAEYDQAGRVFKTNSEDGVVKVMAYDANGNVTIKIISTDNTNTIRTTVNTAASLNALLEIPNTLRTMSVYDSRNQFIKTLQAVMDSTRTVAAVVTNTNSEIAIAPPNPLTGSVTASQAAANPIAMGSSRIGYGNVGWNYAFSGTSTSPTRTANVTVTIPANINLTGSNMRVDVYMTSVGGNTVNGYSYGYIAAGSSSVTITLAAANGAALPKTDVYAPTNYSYPTATSFRLIVSDVNSVKFTDQTWLPVSTQVWVPAYQTGTGAYVTTVAAHWETRNIMPISGSSAAPKRLYFTGQPYTPGSPAVSSSKFLLSYRIDGSTGAYTTVDVPKLATTLPAPNNLVPDTFALDYSALAVGNYEFRYVVLDAAGNILNQQTGTFNTSTATPTISAQTPIAKGGIGYARLDNTGINLINQGIAASSITMRYRVAGTANWLTMAGNFVKGTATTGIGIDSFNLAIASLASLANSTSYEVSYEIYGIPDAVTGIRPLLRIASSYIIKDVNGILSIKDGVGNANSTNPSALSLIKVRLGNQAASTAYIDLTMRPLGSTSAYLPLTRIYANNLGQFDFSIIGMTGNQDIDMRAYDASGKYINHNQAGIYFNQAANVVTVLSVSSLPIPQTIVVKPPQTSADTINPAVNSVTGTVTSTLAASVPAIGSSTLGSGSLTWGSNISYSGGYSYVNSSVTIPTSAASGLGAGNLRVQFTYTIYNLVNGAVSSATVTANTTDGVAVAIPSINIGYAWAADIRGISFAVYKSTAQGEVLVATSSQIGGPLLGGFVAQSEGVYTPVVPAYYTYPATSGVSNAPNRLYLTAQPPATTLLYLSYRAAGSVGAYGLVGVPQMLNAAGTAMTGMFAFDWSSIAAGNYEYQYSALDAAGNLLNVQSGTFNTSNPAAPTVSAQTPIATGGIGRSFVDQYAIRLLNQGSNAASVNMRYRVAGTSYWSAPVALTKNSLGVDSFYLAAASFGLFANSTTYEVDYEVNGTSGNLLRVVSNQIVKDAAGNISLRDGLGNAANAASLALSLTKIRLGGQPANTTYIDWGSRAMGSTAAYTPGVRIYPNSYGKFDLSIVGMPVGTNQELDINAYNAAGLLINRSQADLYINQPANVVTVLTQRAINIPQISVSNADYVVLGYRQKYNSNLLQNWNMAQNSTGYSYTVDGVATGFDFGRNLSTDWTLAGEGTLFLHQTGTAATSSHINSGSQTIAVQAGQRYEVSAYTGAHRANVSLAVTFVDAAGNAISEVTPTAGITTNNLEAAGGTTLAGYKQLWGFVTAPANAVRAIVVVRKSATLAGNTDSWLFVSRMKFNVATPTQTTISDPNNSLLSTSNYTMLPAKQLVMNNGVKEVRIELPLTLANGDYEYQYTTYTAEALNPNAQGSLFVEDFSEPTNKLSKINDPNGLIVVTDQGTAYGSVTMSTGAAVTTNYPALTSPTYTYTAGSLFHAEVTTNELSVSKWSLIGLQGTNSAGQFMRHSLLMDGNNLYAHSNDAAGVVTQTLLTTNVNADTTYVVEVETTTTGTKLYVFEQGKTRAEGWSDTRNAGAWANMNIALYSLQMAGRGTSSVTIDNIGLINNPSATGAQTALGSSNGTFTIGVGTTTANTRLDWALSTSSTVASIQRQQNYNAFGDIVSETDGNGNVTSFTYNTLGKLTQKTDASISITTDNGSILTVNPVTTYTYDAIGRMIATTDDDDNNAANGVRTNTQAWLAGSTEETQTTFERHADGGFIKRSFDVFGNKVSETDRINSLIDITGRTTTYGYDKANQLTQITRPSGVVDSYRYDAAGQRITHTNGLTAYYNTVTGAFTPTTSAVEKTNYDSLGRITQTITNMGYSTNYSYVYTTNVIGLGGSTVNGWIKTTTDSVGRTLVDKTDMFDRTFNHKDLGDHHYTYSYNFAGWLTGQTSTAGQNIGYKHYANGYIKSIHDKSLGMFTYYEYDGNGNRVYEGYAALKDKTNATAGFAEFYQQATIVYDHLNRMTSVTDPKAKIEYEYDAVSNRRRIKSTYHDGVNGSLRVQEYWYKYDVMNRFLITMGTLSGGVITTGTAGTVATPNANNTAAAITYNFVGERTSAYNASNGTTENYSYNADGYLTQVLFNDGRKAVRYNDALGRVYSYQEQAAGTNAVTYYKNTSYDQDNRVTEDLGTDGITGYTYAANGGELVQTHSDSDLDRSDGTGTIVNAYYTYQLWDDAKQATITNQAYNSAARRNNAAWRPGFTDLSYDVNGHISGGIDRVGNRNFRYVNDAQGLILVRDEITGTIAAPSYRYFASTYSAGSIADKINRYYYVDGKRVGDVSNDGASRTDYVTAMAQRNTQVGNYANWKPVGSADFDQNYEPIGPNNPGAVASSYTVRNGDTLQSIAQTVWGDSAMWYLIADANGLISGSTLSTNMVLIIPNKVTNIHNNAGTFRPYNPGEAMGDINPTLPAMPKPPKKKGCGGFLSIIVAVIAIAATIMTAGALAAPSASLLGTFSAGVGVLGGSAVATGTLTAGAAFGIGLAAGAVGSIVGQVAGLALGVQDKFSWGAVAAGAIGAGIGASGVLGSIAGGNVVGQAIAGNIINQGVGIITGAQKGFSWAGVAAAAIAAPITSSIGKSIKDSNFGGAGTAGYAIRGAATGIATSTVNELTRVAIVGGKLNWSSVAIGGISGGIYGYGEGLNSQRQQVAGTGIQLTEEQGNRLTKGIKIPELEDRINIGFSSADVENFQLKTTVGSSSEENRNGLNQSFLSSAAEAGVTYTAAQYMVDKVIAKSAQNKVADNLVSQTLTTNIDNQDSKNSQEVRKNLEQAKVSLNALGNYNVDANANVLMRAKQIVDGEGINNIADALAKGNNWEARGIAFKTAAYDMIAPEGYLGAGLLVAGGPLLSYVGKGFSAALPKTSSWLSSVASKEISMFGASKATASIPSGVWQSVNEAMSVRAAAYQTQVTGRTGQSYVANGVKFDGAELGVYLEAKGPGYANFVNKNGEFYGWYNGEAALLSQAQRQVVAAKGVPIEWRVAEQKAADAMRNLFRNEGVKGVTVIYTPVKVIK